MSATDELRRMLDERGVEYEGGKRSVRWRDRNGVMMQAFPLADGELGMDVWSCTPEQAIAATLGREPDDAAMAKLHDQMNAAMLKYEMAQGIEKRDGDGAIVVPWVLKMHALLEEAATLGSCNCSDNCTNGERTETCTADETDTWECVCDGIGRYGKRVTVHVMECSECGRTYEHVNGPYEYCPHCRARITEVTDG